MRTKPFSRSFSTGFTLIEVMVALIIVSLGMMAVNTQLNRYAVTARIMEDKTLASWIGANKITELSIEPVWPEVGDSNEEVDFAGREWNLTIVVSPTDVDNLRRVDVDVSLADKPDVIVDRISGLIEPPVPAGFVPVRWMGPGQGAGG
jgi:general secretion pathway protein I